MEIFVLWKYYASNNFIIGIPSSANYKHTLWVLIIGGTDGIVGNLETHRIACVCTKRLRRTHAREGIHLACWEVIRGCVDCANLAGALVLEGKAGRCIGTIAAAAQGARWLILARDTLALDTCDT